MAKTKISSATRYREIRQTRRAEQLKTAETFLITTASGMEWRVRRPSLETYLINGIMPNSLIEKLEAAMKTAGADDTDAAEQMTTQDSLKTLIFAREMVRDICVCPRITDTPKTDDDIHPGEIELDDFQQLVQWGMQNSVGGEEARRLANFRG